MTTPTKRDAIDAAMSVADDVAHGRLDPTALQQQAVTECRELFGTVVGEGDPLWTLQADVARQAVGLGALSPEELREWAAVLDLQRGVEPAEPPAPHNEPLTLESSVSGEAGRSESPNDEGDVNPAPLQGVSVGAALTALADAARQARAQPDGHSVAAVFTSQRPSSDNYDGLDGWNPGGSRRL
ncbi:flagellar hook-length control protein [Mycolicibacterium sp.]|uniref:flagellar hook-length control protein n=1 Tax=Mycolicibacterium sp. TaxID=2320850 RepID=UPI003D129B76